MLPVMLPRDEKKLSENLFYIYKLFKTSAQWIRRVFFFKHIVRACCKSRLQHTRV